METIINRKSVIGTYYNLEEYADKVIKTQDCELIKDYFYYLGMIEGFVDTEQKSDDINYYVPDFWDSLEYLADKLRIIK